MVGPAELSPRLSQWKAGLPWQRWKSPEPPSISASGRGQAWGRQVEGEPPASIVVTNNAMVSCGPSHSLLLGIPWQAFPRELGNGVPMSQSRKPGEPVAGLHQAFLISVLFSADGCLRDVMDKSPGAPKSHWHRGSHWLHVHGSPLPRLAHTWETHRQGSFQSLLAHEGVTGRT